MTGLEPHPIFELPTLEWVETHGGRPALEAYISERIRLMQKEKEDPLTYGFEPAIWNVVDDLLCDGNSVVLDLTRIAALSPDGKAPLAVDVPREMQGAAEVWIGGSQRSSKSEYAGKKCMKVLKARNGRRGWSFADTGPISIARQQPIFWKYMPPEVKRLAAASGKARQGAILNVSYKQKTGFAEQSFVLPNASQHWFKNYEQDIENVEGDQLDVIWLDELRNPMLLKTLRYRMGDRGGIIIVTFTSIDENYNAIVHEYERGSRTILEVEAELLPIKRPKENFSRSTFPASAGGDKQGMAATVEEGTAPNSVKVNAGANVRRSNSANVKSGVTAGETAPISAGDIRLRNAYKGQKEPREKSGLAGWKTVETRFKNYFKTDPVSGCWLWTGGTVTDGYGKFWINDKHERAHRVAWQLYRGAIPEGLNVLHKCDVPSCVNPDHLFLGSQSDNIRDAIQKGRVTTPSPRGEDHPFAKLTEEKVREIRTSSETSVQLAQRFGVSQTTINDARAGRIWGGAGQNTRETVKPASSQNLGEEGGDATCSEEKRLNSARSTAAPKVQTSGAAEWEIVGYEKVPRIKVAGPGSDGDQKANIVYFHITDNPYYGFNADAKPGQRQLAGKDRFYKLIAGATREKILARAYGILTRSSLQQFPMFRDAVHVLEPERVPKAGTNYLVVDPCDGRNWFMIWVRVDVRGHWYVYREWPSTGHPGAYIPGIGDPGPWALPGEPADGVRGPAQKPFGFGLERYIQEILRLEGKEQIQERWMDSRYAAHPTVTKEGSTTHIEQLSELGMEFLAASGKEIIEGTGLINDKLDYDIETELGKFSATLARLNEPKLFISRNCANVIYSLREWTNKDKGHGACKDPIDVLRYATLAGLDYIGEDAYAWHGGGSY